ncbi:hypothetical protein [Rickettsia endosymbiont of Cardiosporidium cionae]|uniref:hypothetical protein n=1 Tax=Rickettsia endosymbiont of Cardiosporidium cionae TaxID=2777155 RepID=UPI001894E5DC|nr:hypothetical protein [Rickettsia endosymbiont of Cardiosporidium cionae]KAF8818278.1 hypothetical protein IHI24_000737 [Rickettsia endosymbiont of Cardiosporidium cionae]
MEIITTNNTIHNSPKERLIETTSKKIINSTQDLSQGNLLKPKQELTTEDILYLELCNQKLQSAEEHQQLQKKMDLIIQTQTSTVDRMVKIMNKFFSETLKKDFITKDNNIVKDNNIAKIEIANSTLERIKNLFNSLDSDINIFGEKNSIGSFVNNINQNIEYIDNDFQLETQPNQSEVFITSDTKISQNILNHSHEYINSTIRALKLYSKGDEDYKNTYLKAQEQILLVLKFAETEKQKIRDANDITISEQEKYKTFIHENYEQNIVKIYDEIKDAINLINTTLIINTKENQLIEETIKRAF